MNSRCSSSLLLRTHISRKKVKNNENRRRRPPFRILPPSAREEQGRGEGDPSPLPSREDLGGCGVATFPRLQEGGSCKCRCRCRRRSRMQNRISEGKNKRETSFFLLVDHSLLLPQKAEKPSFNKKWRRGACFNSFSPRKRISYNSRRPLKVNILHLKYLLLLYRTTAMSSTCFNDCFLLLFQARDGLQPSRPPHLPHLEHHHHALQPPATR